MKRWISIIMCFAFCVSIFSGCFGNNSPVASETPQEDESADDGVLNVASPFGGNGALAVRYKSLVDEFTAGNPSVKLNAVSGSNDAAWREKIVGQFDSSSQPDVVFFHRGSPAEKMVSRGDFVTIDTIRSVYPEYATNLSNTSLSEMREKDGGIYAVPVMGSYEGIFVHRDLFAQYGLELPTDWNKFLKAVIAFSKTNIIPLSASLSDHPQNYVDSFILSAGGSAGFSAGTQEIRAARDVVSNESGAVASGSDSANSGNIALASWATGLDVVKGLYDMGAFIVNTSSTNNKISIDTFNAKQSAMRFDNSWFIYDVVDKEDTVFMPVPVIEGGLKTENELVGGFTMGFYISKKAWNDPQKRDAAVKFVMHMTSNEAINRFSELCGAPSTPLNQPDGNNLSKSAKEVYSSAEILVPEMIVRVNNQSWNYLMQNIGQIVDNKISVDEVLEGFELRN